MIDILENGTFWLPEQASTIAAEVDWLFYFVLWASLIIFAGVVTAMIYFAWRYKRRHPEERGQLIEENKLLEISWIVAPTILVLLLFTWGFQTFIKMGTAPPGAYEIRVVGQQWNWKFIYPNGTEVSSVLHVPANRPVRLRMSSTDVIHSFFVPAFRVKQDVLPNRYTSLWFEATEVDTFQVYCTEYCGTQHSGMLAEVVVMEPPAFQQWVRTGGGVANLAPAEYGALLYERLACNTCHSIDGSPNVGPTFQGLFGSTEQLASGAKVTVDANYLRRSILEPGAQIVAGYQNLMPASYSTLSEKQLSALIAFIEEQ